MPRPSARKTNISTVRATVNAWLAASPGLQDEMGVEGITQTMLAERLKISRSYLQAVELGKRPLPDGMASEAGRLLGVDPRWILAGTGEPVTRSGKPWRLASFRRAWARATAFPASPLRGVERAAVGILHASIRREVEAALAELRYRQDSKRHSRALLAAIQKVRREMAGAR